MKRWSFNYLLLSKLSDVLDISGAEIARRCGIRQQVFNRYTHQSVALSVVVLMKICNALRMPAHYFMSEDNNHILPNRETATIPPDCWHIIEWDYDAVERTFGDGNGRIYWKDVAEVMGVSEQKPHARFKLETRFPIDDFLNTCSTLNVSPFMFLIDKNRDKAKQKGGKRTTMPNASASGDAFHRSEITVLTQKLAALNSTVANITAKYDDLMKRHTALLDRHNLLERRFNDFMGCGSMKVAEDIGGDI